MLNININQKRLSDVLKKAQKSVPSNPTMDILKNIKLVSSKYSDSINIIATDGDIYTRQNIVYGDDLEIIEKGDICIPAKQFMETIRLMTSETISLKLEENTLLIKGQKEGNKNKSTMKINVTDGSNFPNPDNGREGLFAEIEGNELKEMIKKTSYATTKNESRPILTGVLFSKRYDKLDVTATDSHRLSKYYVDLEGFRNEDSVNDHVIPKGSLDKIVSYIKDDDRVDMFQNEKSTSISFYTNDMFIQTRVLTGNYPDTDRIIPKETKTTVEINKEEFKLALQRARITSESDGNSAVNFSLNDEDNTITLKSNNENGQSTEVFEAEKIEGEEIELAFNIDYMLDAIKRLDYDTVVLNFISNMQPIVIRESGLTQLVLPVRVY